MFREKMGRGEVQAQCSATVVAIELVGADGGRRTADADEGGHAYVHAKDKASDSLTSFSSHQALRTQQAGLA